MLKISKISIRFFCKFGMVSPKYTIHRSNIKPISCWAEIFALYGNYADAPSTSFSNGDKFCKAARYQQTDSVAPPQASQATHSAKEALCGTSAYSTSSGLPVCSGHNGISIGGDSSGLGFYSLMSRGLTLVIMTVEFEFLEEEGNVLLIIVSLRGTDLEVGVLWYGVALWVEGKQISL